jgi:hypothetical protein
MGGRRRWWSVAVALAVAMSVAGCTGGDGRTELKADDDGSEQSASVAAANGFSRASSSLDEMTVEGLGLQVDYFEAMRKGDWVAPDHCWFPTRVSVSSMLTSPGFRGPSSDDDRAAGDGVLVGSLRQGVAVDGSVVVTEGGAIEPPHSAPGDGPTQTTTATAPPEEPPVEYRPDQMAPTTVTGGGGADDVTPPVPVGDPSAVPTTVVGEPGPPPDRPDPARIVDATVVVAAVFGHDQVAELSSAGTPADEGRGSDTAPVDGWALLSVALDPSAIDGAETATVQLRRVGEDGSTRTEDLTVDLRSKELQVPDEWRFDLEGVDAECTPPGGDPDNVAPDPESDLFGSPIGDAPTLPPAGAQPDDPTTATSDGLAALRTVYDLGDVWAESKKEHVENPEDYLRMRQELLVNDVVRPYMSALDPTFRNSVFVSPTELHVLYRVGPTYQWEIGRVLLIDGRWRVANGTLCRDLAAAGYHCKNAEPDAPPGPLG